MAKQKVAAGALFDLNNIADSQQENEKAVWAFLTKFGNYMVYLSPPKTEL